MTENLDLSAYWINEHEGRRSDLHQNRPSRLHLYPEFDLHVPNLDDKGIKDREVNIRAITYSGRKESRLVVHCEQAISLRQLGSAEWVSAEVHLYHLSGGRYLRSCNRDYLY